MVFSINPDNLENNDFRLVDDAGDLELLHKPSGATFTYDAGEGAWIPSAGFGTEANPVSGTSHFEAVEAEKASIDQVAAKVFNDDIDTSVDNTDTTEVDWDTIGFEDQDVVEIDLDNNQITIQESGTYLLTAIITWQSSSNWSTGDRVRLISEVNGSELRPFIDRGRKLGTEDQAFDHTNIAKLSENDNVSISVWQDSGETQSIFSRNTRNGLTLARLG